MRKLTAVIILFDRMSSQLKGRAWDDVIKKVLGFLLLYHLGMTQYLAWHRPLGVPEKVL